MNVLNLFFKGCDLSVFIVWLLSEHPIKFEINNKHKTELKYFIIDKIYALLGLGRLIFDLKDNLSISAFSLLSPGSISFSVSDFGRFSLQPYISITVDFHLNVFIKWLPMIIFKNNSKR